MSPLDGYEPFRELVDVLRQLGHASAASQIDDAMSAGATGSEILGDLGLALKGLRSVLNDHEVESLRDIFGRCTNIIRQAWPDYR